jgi:hypothetical protein
MRNSIWLWFTAFTVPMALGLPALSDEYDELPAKPHLTATLVARLKANPCEVLEEIFRATTDSQKICSKLRESNGDLLVDLSLKYGDKTIGLMKVGRKCQEGIVAADARPKKVPRWVSYVDVALVASDDQTLDFTGWMATVKAGTDGSLETIGKGCGPEISGRVRFAKNRWRLLGPRSEGCSE